MDKTPDYFEKIVLRRHRLELALFQLLPSGCCNGLTETAPAAECGHCRLMINHAFLNPNWSEEQAVDTVIYHLANRDNCESALILRCAEADRELKRLEEERLKQAAAPVTAFQDTLAA